MVFRDLNRQYLKNKQKIDEAIQNVLFSAQYIGGTPVSELERRLEEYVGVKHCITCANGTDALQLALMAWGIGKGDAVFVPDFTFFSTAEVVPCVGATPIFVDIEQNTFNMSVDSLERAILRVKEEGKLKPRVIIAVDLFGQPADYKRIRRIADMYGLFVLEDGAQGFGGGIGNRKACSFGDISTTSFFPAKPLGCYGDGGAIFTDNDEWETLLRSYKVHGKGQDKYDNIRIGMNSRLDTIQAAVLLAKLDSFIDFEIAAVNQVADFYSAELKDFLIPPVLEKGYMSSWAQYTVILKNSEQRDGVSRYLHKKGIPTMVYYSKPLHIQTALLTEHNYDEECAVTMDLCKRVLSLPIHPYIEEEEVADVIMDVKDYFANIE